jgi:hypothetical protein
MGKSLTPKVLPPLPPENSSLLALPPPETTVKECTSSVPIMQQCGGSAAISELQGLNISDLFTDFSSSSLQRLISQMFKINKFFPPFQDVPLEQLTSTLMFQNDSSNLFINMILQNLL